MSEADLSFQNNLVRFKDKVDYIRKNPDYKSGEVMSVDSAIMHIETLFNATYSFADERYGRTKIDTATVLIDVTPDDEVAMDDVVSVFDEILNTVTQFYYQCQFEQKGFILLNLTRGELVGNDLNIEIRSVTGQKSTTWEPFGVGDDWWFGEEVGRCDGTDSTDAAIQLQIAINNNKPLVSPPAGYRFAYSGQETIDLFGHEYKNPFGEYYIFYIEDINGNFTPDEKCIEHDTMNIYFNREKELIYSLLPDTLNKPSNWTFIECTFEGLEEENPYKQRIPTIHHQNSLDYALRHLVKMEFVGPPVDL